MCVRVNVHMGTDDEGVCVLSSANATLPFLVGHQKPALAENQLQVTSLALALSVSRPRWRQYKHSARIPKRAGQWWRGARYPTGKV